MGLMPSSNQDTLPKGPSGKRSGEDELPEGPEKPQIHRTSGYAPASATPEVNTSIDLEISEWLSGQQHLLQ